MNVDKPKTARDLDQNSKQFDLVLFALPAILFSLILGFFLSSYLGFRLSGSLILHADDGWCDTAFQGLGIHCFGDFSSFMNYDVQSPWANSMPTAYPPLSVLFMGLFQGIYSITNGSNLSLQIYLTLLVLSLVSPAYFFIKSGFSKLMTLTIFSFFILLAPSLMIIDRGNNLGFCVPWIFVGYYFAVQKKYFHFQVIVVVLTLLKPQFGFLSLLLLFRRQNRLFLVFLLNSITGYLTFFLFFGPKEIFSNLYLWIVNVLNYQSYVGLPAVYPSNISFANLFALALTTISKIDARLEQEIKEIFLQSESASLVSLIFMFMILVSLYARRNSLNDIQIITALLISLIMIPAVSFAYYLSVLLPFVYLFIYSIFTQNVYGNIRFENFSDKLFIQFQTIFKSKSQRFVFRGLVLTCLINWPIPWSIFGISPVGGRSGDLSMIWIVSPIFLLLFLLTMIFGDLVLRFSESVRKRQNSLAQLMGSKFPRKFGG